MSELKVDKISPLSGTAATFGDSGDTFTVPSGATLTIAGALNVTGTTALADGTVAIAELDIDGSTDIGAAIVDGDLFIIDDGADGTNRKTAASRLATYVEAGIVGTQTIWVPSAAMRATSSNGCAAITDVETTSGRPDLQVLDFDNGSDEHAQFQIGFPKSWNEGTVTFRAFWTSTATDTDGVAWGLQGVSVANDGTIDVAYGTAIVVTDDNISAAEDCLVTATSSAVTIASAAADTMTFFRIFRDISDGNDDMAEDARLIGVQIFFTIDAINDA